MPYRLKLPRALRERGWKVKIREKERLEPPHLTILRGGQTWRLGLRSRGFLIPPGGVWNEIDPEVRELIEDEDNWDDLCNAWDAMYPSNPVSSEDDDDDA